ncbi:hypothetical protein [Mycobacteroides abscessus]|uniref:hypothetical protein n=1 Tax=Mycobacteroides abscessus TaxID=36809 RepID=UPI00266C8801|nr:hypothetical protein [Mycobacteroides abscessus]MDO3216148.1 hypothetical protein [Mycobacteroides abscessus subsp. abscessus]
MSPLGELANLPRSGNATPRDSGPQWSAEGVFEVCESADVAQHRAGQDAPDGGVRDPAGQREWS